MLSGDYKGVLEDASQVINFEENNANAFRNRAWGYLLEAESELTLKEIEQALVLEETSAEAHGILARIALFQGDLEKACATSLQAFAIERTGVAAFILTQLYCLLEMESDDQVKLAEAQELGDEHFFNVLDEWIAQIGKRFREKKERTIEEHAVKKEEGMKVIPASLPSYSSQKLAMASFVSETLKNKKTTKIIKKLLKK